MPPARAGTRRVPCCWGAAGTGESVATAVWELYNALLRDTSELDTFSQVRERAHPGIIDEFKTIYDAWDPYWTERIGGPQADVVSQRVIDFFLATGPPEHTGQAAYHLLEG